MAGPGRVVLRFDKFWHLPACSGRGVIDAHMQVLPAHATGVGLAGSVTRDAVSGTYKPPELLDVEMNHVAGVITDIALHPCRRTRQPFLPAAGRLTLRSRPSGVSLAFL